MKTHSHSHNLQTEPNLTKPDLTEARNGCFKASLVNRAPFKNEIVTFSSEMMLDDDLINKLQNTFVDAARQQHETLVNILQHNGGVSYIQPYIRGYGAPVDAATFPCAMPLSCYDDFFDYIKKLTDGVVIDLFSPLTHYSISSTGRIFDILFPISYDGEREPQRVRATFGRGFRDKNQILNILNESKLWSRSQGC